jgi:hypothetical protein
MLNKHPANIPSPRRRGDGGLNKQQDNLISAPVYECLLVLISTKFSSRLLVLNKQQQFCARAQNLSQDKLPNRLGSLKLGVKIPLFCSTPIAKGTTKIGVSLGVKIPQILSPHHVQMGGKMAVILGVKLREFSNPFEAGRVRKLIASCNQFLNIQ